MAATTIRDDHAHIAFVFVLPEYQTCGVGEALVHDAATGKPIGAYVVSRDHEECRVGPVLANQVADVSSILRRALAAAREVGDDTSVTEVTDVP